MKLILMGAQPWEAQNQHFQLCVAPCAAEIWQVNEQEEIILCTIAWRKIPSLQPKKSRLPEAKETPRGGIARARPARGPLAATSVANKERKVKQMSDMIQYSWVYGLNLKPPAPLQLQQTAPCHKQFVSRVLPNAGTGGS